MLSLGYHLIGGCLMDGFLLFRSILEPLAKIQKRIKAYEITVPPTTARSFDALPHSVTLVITGCNAFPGQPYQTIAIKDFEKQADDKAYDFLPCRSLLVPKCPVLVQEKTTQRAARIGNRIVRHQDQHSVCGKAPQKNIEDQQINAVCLLHQSGSNGRTARMCCSAYVIDGRQHLVSYWMTLPVSVFLSSLSKATTTPLDISCFL